MQGFHSLSTFTFTFTYRGVVPMHPQMNIWQNVRALVDISQRQPHCGHHPLPDPGLMVAFRGGEESCQVDVVAMVVVAARVLLVAKAAAFHLPAGSGCAAH